MSTHPIAPDPWIEYLMSVDTPTLANAIELLKLRPHNQGFTPLQVRCLFPELGRMCGYAVTAQVETMTGMGKLDRGLFTELYRAVDASPKPAVVVLQEIGGHADYAAHCGEVMATFFTRLGAVGLVSDCGVRDIPEVRAMGFRYFARGAVSSHAFFRIAQAQRAGADLRPGGATRRRAARRRKRTAAHSRCRAPGHGRGRGSGPYERKEVDGVRARRGFLDRQVPLGQGGVDGHERT